MFDSAGAGGINRVDPVVANILSINKFQHASIADTDLNRDTFTWGREYVTTRTFCLV
jgi:hypothetical protein